MEQKMISVMIMVNVLVKNIMVLKNVMNVLMDILVSLIAKHVLVMIKGLKVPLVMLVDNVHVNPMLLEVIAMNVNMSIMDFQIAKVLLCLIWNSNCFLDMFPVLLSTIFDAISACECNEEGSVLDEHQHATCFDNGRCTCKGPNIAGDKCDQCAPGT